MSDDPTGNPFSAPQDEPIRKNLSRDPSIFDEPHLAGDYFGDGDSQDLAAQTHLNASRPTANDAVDHTVWDEPALSPALAADQWDETALTYRRWLEARLAMTTRWDSWRTTLMVVLTSGIAAVLGTLVSSVVNPTGSGLLMVCIFGPITEEVMKLAWVIWIVEKRPYLFRSASQILLCGLTGGLAFAAIENVLYLQGRFPNHSMGLFWWRWTVCVALHTGCSLIAASGLVRVWRQCMQERARPVLATASGAMILAMLIHGIYNTLAVVWSMVF